MNYFIQFFGIIVGAIVTLIGLSTWKNQKIGGKRIDLAESIIIHFTQFEENFSFIANDFVSQSDFDEASKIFSHNMLIDPVYVRAEVRKKRASDFQEKMVDFFGQKHIAFAYFGSKIFGHFLNANKLYTSNVATWAAISSVGLQPNAERFVSECIKREKHNVVYYTTPSEFGAKLEIVVQSLVEDLHHEINKKGGPSYWKEWIWPSI